MIKKVLVFGASNSKNSINKKFAIYAASRLQNVEINAVDLNDYASPLYSIDLEKENGIHENATQLYELIKSCDAIVISVAEYNGLHTSAFKNLWDWLSRIPMEKPINIWDGKPMFLLSTSPSRKASNNVFKVSNELFPHFGAEIIAAFYLPSFHHFFKENEIVDSEYKQKFKNELEKFQSYITSN